MIDYSEQFQNLNSINECIAKRDELLSQGRITEIKSLLIQASPEEKKLLGAELNKLKSIITTASSNRIQEIQKSKEVDSFIEFDPTFYSNRYQNKSGHLHPITLITNQIVSIFRSLGFDVWDGQHIQSQYNNFTAVNTPDYHPARDMQDTFFLEPRDQNGENLVMRTQVTANIIPYAKNHQPPFKVIFPGVVFRNENIDATHDINFTQFDMWLVDRNCSIADLVDLIKRFFSELYNDPSLTIRLRPSYFPFTQPSFEGDISCPFCKGEGCKICKHTGWIEVFGAGPIHENVIKNMQLDPSEWEGLAFGFGVDRLAQLMFKVSGISQFYNGHLDFLRGEE